MEKEKRSLFQRFLLWREKNIKEKQFILILSFLVGIFTAITALILKMLIHWIQNFLTNNFNTTEANYLYLVYPVVGIFLAGLFVRYVVKDDISHGVTKILYAISRRQGRIKRHNTWSSVIASSITIGTGHFQLFFASAIKNNVYCFFWKILKWGIQRKAISLCQCLKIHIGDGPSIPKRPSRSFQCTL